MKLSLREFALAVGISDVSSDVVVTGISVDSRTLSPGDVFCAVEGSRVDGHNFVQQAVERGAVALLVSKDVPASIPVLKVNNVVSALAMVAKEVRSRFSGDVIGVTGSVGKSTVKELLSAALGGPSVVMKTPGNLNSEYGVPMAWMHLEPFHQFAVIEMGMRGKGHIAHLCSFSRPNIGVITAIGLAHVGELGSRENIVRAKGELIESLPESGVAILPAGQDFSELASLNSCRVISFGDSGDVCVVNSETRVSENKTSVKFSCFGQEFVGELPGLGAALARNGAAVLATAHAVGADMDSALKLMSSAEMPAGRLTAIPFGKGTILVDVYNSSPESCREALDVLSSAAGKKTAILGDMLELGGFASEEHYKVGLLLGTVGVSHLCLVGELSKEIGRGAIDSNPNISVEHFSTSESAAHVMKNLEDGETVLIKGSRGMQMENALTSAGVKF